jgi:hypothetical protein
MTGLEGLNVEKGKIIFILSNPVGRYFSLYDF